MEEVVDHPLCCCRQRPNQYYMEVKCIASKEEGVCSGYGMPGPATLYFMPHANLGCSKMHLPRIDYLLVFGSAAGGTGQAAAIGIMSNGTIFLMMYSTVKIVTSSNGRIERFICALYLCPWFTKLKISIRPCARWEGQTVPYNGWVQLAPNCCR